MQYKQLFNYFQNHFNSLYPKLYPVYGTCSLLSLTLAHHITSLLHFSTTYPYFGALATQSFFSDKELRLRQTASRVRCLLFRLQPPPTKVSLHLGLLCLSLHLHVLYSFIHLTILLPCRLRPFVVVGCLHRGVHHSV